MTTERQQIHHGREIKAYVSNTYNQLDSPARHLKELTPHTKDKRAHNQPLQCHGVHSGGMGGARKIFTRLQALDYSLLAQTHEQLRERIIPERMWQVAGT